MPVYALELGPSKQEINKQKFDKLFKQKPINKVFDNLNNSLKLKLKLPKGDYSKKLPEINKVKFDEATLFLEQRLKKDEIKLDLTYENLSERDKVVAESVRNLSMLGFAMFAVLWAMPEELTKWDKDREISDVFDKWQENVKDGPVVDEDDWAVNFIGHPLSGAYEYMFLRNAGFSKLESFGFAVFVSTVMWEYGIEAFAEVPSIQDLLLTPTIGALLGEAFHVMDSKLKDNDYILLNSRRFGRIVHHIINPVEGINNSFEKLFGLKFLHLDKAHFYMKNDVNLSGDPAQFGEEGRSYGIRFVFTF